jgi:HSP20 family molecular chaperone IbpA
MKTYPHAHIRIWTTGLIAAGLGLSAIASTPSAPDDKSGANSGAGNSQTWEDQFNDRMQHIQKEMDDLFRDSMTGLDAAEKDVLAGPKFDASSTVQDRGDSYVATFNLPRRNLSNVKINVKDGVLSVNARAEQTTKSDTTTDKSNFSSETEMLDQYEQLVTLPGPVDAAQIKVEKHGDSVVITLPKKTGKTGAAK